jgi:precorrin-8X/cobalt-precorrin-8 methylmutase
MSVSIQKVSPLEIEAESFRIIEAELGTHTFSEGAFKIVQRIIHATGDFSFADNIRFSPNAIEHGLAAIRSGQNILTDVNMAATGISKKLLAQWGGRVICKVADKVIAAEAKSLNKTRSELAIEQGLLENIGIVAIGNAPTALLKVLQCFQDKDPAECPLIIGLPVGFVNAAESKDLLYASKLPFITSLGRKGGSPVAAAAVNALLRLAAR